MLLLKTLDWIFSIFSFISQGRSLWPQMPDEYERITFDISILFSFKAFCCLAYISISLLASLSLLRIVLCYRLYSSLPILSQMPRWYNYMLFLLSYYILFWYCSIYRLCVDIQYKISLTDLFSYFIHSLISSRPSNFSFSSYRLFYIGYSSLAALIIQTQLPLTASSVTSAKRVSLYGKARKIVIPRHIYNIIFCFHFIHIFSFSDML